MVFIGGARQVGKTSLARFIGENHFPAHQYLNWDYTPDRRDILQYRFKGNAKSCSSMKFTNTRIGRII